MPFHTSIATRQSANLFVISKLTAANSIKGSVLPKQALPIANGWFNRSWGQFDHNLEQNGTKKFTFYLGIHTISYGIYLKRSNSQPSSRHYVPPVVTYFILHTIWLLTITSRVSRVAKSLGLCKISEHNRNDKTIYSLYHDRYSNTPLKTEQSV